MHLFCSARLATNASVSLEIRPDAKPHMRRFEDTYAEMAQYWPVSAKSLDGE